MRGWFEVTIDRGARRVGKTSGRLPDLLPLRGQELEPGSFSWVSRNLLVAKTFPSAIHRRAPPASSMISLPFLLEDFLLLRGPFSAHSGERFQREVVILATLSEIDAVLKLAAPPR